MSATLGKFKFGLSWWLVGASVLAISTLAGIVLMLTLRSRDTSTATDFATAYSASDATPFYTAPKDDDTSQEAVLAELAKYGDPDDNSKPSGEQGTKFQNFPLAVDPDDARRLLSAGSKLKLDVQSEAYIECTLGELALYLHDIQKATYHLERARKAGSKAALTYLARPEVGEKPMVRYEQLKAALDAGYKPARELLVDFKTQTEALLDREAGHPDDKENQDPGIADGQLAAEPAEHMRQILEDYLGYAQLDDVPGRFLFEMGRLAYFLNFDAKATVYLTAATSKKLKPSIGANYYLAKLLSDDDDPDFLKRRALLKSAVDAGFKQAEPEFAKIDSKIFRLSSFVGQDAIKSLLLGDVESLFNNGVKFQAEVDPGTELQLRRVFTIVYISSFVKYFEDPEPTFISDGHLKDLVIGGSAGTADYLMKLTSEATKINLAQLLIPFGVAKQNIPALGGSSGGGWSNIIGIVTNIAVGGGHISDSKDIRFSIVQEMAVMDARNCLLYWRDGNKKDVKQIYLSAVKFVHMRDVSSR